MWPFSRRWRAPDELVASLQECQSQQRELVARIKVVEREIDDLHDFYRRLRARAAGDKRAADAEGQAGVRSSNLSDPGEPANAKEALRARVLGGHGLRRVIPPEVR